MCGRYAAAKDPNALAEEFETASVPAELLAPDYNVAPTKKVYIVVDIVSTGAHWRWLGFTSGGENLGRKRSGG